MANQALRLVGGSELRPGVNQQVQPERRPATGWPLSPTLLAALHSATPEMKRLCENMVRINLKLPQLPQL